MTTQINACTTSACDAFSLDGIKLGTRGMSQIMVSADEGEQWAKDILAADQQTVEGALALHPGNTRANTYGALRFGIYASIQTASTNPEVVQALQGWKQALQQQFPGRTSYEPQDLLQMASDLVASAGCIEKNTQTLAANEQLTAGAAQSLNTIVGGMRSLAKNLKGLHTAVCACPGLTQVILDIAPKKH